MLLLLSTTDKLQLITSAAATVDVVASMQDKTTSSGALASVSQRTAISTAATTDIVAAPASGVERNIKELSIRNKHATLSVDVTPILDANGTDYEIVKFTLLPGQTLEYIEGIGWFKLESTALLNRTMRLASDYVNATTSFTDITGLSCPLLSGRFYNFEAALFDVNDAATTGSRYGYNIGAAPTTSIIGIVQTTLPHATAPTFAAGVVTARDTAIIAATAGSTSQRCSWLAGMIQPSADGTFVLRGASEVAVAAGLTVKAGSWLRIWEPTG